MTEQEQAEKLANWLAEATGPPPDGVDTDVLETVFALKPELAPPPSLTADDILATVTTGPLAEGGMPTNASLGAPPMDAPEAGTSKRRVPWLIAGLGGIGGIGAIAAAAIGLLVLGNLNGPANLSAPAGAPIAAAPAERAIPELAEELTAGGEGVAAVDEGILQGVRGGERIADTGVAKRMPKVATSRPAPKPRPAADSPAMRGPADLPISADAPSIADLGYVDDLEEAKEEQLARGEEDLDAKIFDDDMVRRDAAGGRPVIPEASQPTFGFAEPAADPEPEPMELDARTTAPAMEPPPMAAPAPPPMMAPGTAAPAREVAAGADMDDFDAEGEAEEVISTESRRRSSPKRPQKKAKDRSGISLGAKKSAPAAPVAEAVEQAPAQPTANLDALRRSAVPRGDTSQGPAAANLSQAEAALASGDAGAAISAANAGLAVLGSTNSAQRAKLYVVLGDAQRQAGDVLGAERSYRQAVALNLAR